MKKNTRFHLLFEQSGSFKTVLRSYGHEAYDYDILNEFGETDYQLDLFKEIEVEYDNIKYNRNEKTIFTDMKSNKDFIIAFFPCTHFADANQLQYRLWIGGKKRDLNIESSERIIERNLERAYFFEIYLKFATVLTYKNLRAIIENPASSGIGNYLKMFSPLDVGYYEKDRSLYGDAFKKPTNYFVSNFKMVEKVILNDKEWETINIYDIQSKKTSTGGRSRISNNYIENFYLRFFDEKVE